MNVPVRFLARVIFFLSSQASLCTVDVASGKLLALKQGPEWAAIEPRGRSFAYLRYVSIPGGAK